MLRIVLASVFVEDQAKALTFYTDVLGFVKKEDVPVGEARWLTVVSPADPDGMQLLLEPNGNEVARTYQQGLKAQGFSMQGIFRYPAALSPFGMNGRTLSLQLIYR